MKAFLYGTPIGLLGGLIGLGGAEFRLPVLTRIFGYKATDAVPVNLAVSLLTVVAALASRLSTISGEALLAYVPAIGMLAVASMTGAYVGTSYLYRIHESGIERVIMVLLAAIGGVLVVESFVVFTPQRLVDGALANILLELVLGFGIGIVSSLLGIAGGELIIPTLILVFGVEVKLAGTASLIISTATIIVGFLRYLRLGSYNERCDITQVVLPMGLGSIVGAVIGGALVGVVSSEHLKLLLGLLLITSAVKMFHPPAAVPIPNTTLPLKERSGEG
jgi:uncharacterized membrane protein YfcA